jgi:hypothetical protein
VGLDGSVRVWYTSGMAANGNVRQWEAARREALADALPGWAVERVMALLVDLAEDERVALGAPVVTAGMLRDAVQAVRDGLV